MPSAPRIAFYGDDFTGSTDVLESLAAAGLRTVLFTAVPSPTQLARFADAQAIGIAGCGRTLTPGEMEEVIPDVLEALRQTGAPILHYKVCSTFDSSPTIGSFGRVMDIAKRVLGAGTIPIVVGAPKLGRYALFGTLFARHNVDGTVHRLDRHPTMSVHPTTPMREADMRRHIGAQTEQRIALLPAPAIAGPPEAALAALEGCVGTGTDALMIDIVDETAEARVGLLLGRMAARTTPLFVVGSSGVESALVAHWRAENSLPQEVSPQAPAPVDRLFVISGSCSPVTGAQIAAARSSGFEDIALDPVALIAEGEGGDQVGKAVDRAVDLLRTGRSVVAHSSTGPEDPREKAVAAYLTQAGLSGEDGRIRGGRALARAAGRVLGDVLDRVDLKRFVVAGGDTSTAAVDMLGIDALEWVAPLAPGAPLCRIRGEGHRLDGCEIVLKGGQMGGPAFFSQVKAGRP